MMKLMDIKYDILNKGLCRKYANFQAWQENTFLYFVEENYLLHEILLAELFMFAIFYF